jgi:multiple sugar transport system ATP-binding protein
MLTASGHPVSEVVVVEPTGADTFMACRHQGPSSRWCSASATTSQPGSTIHLQPDLQRAHLFDAGDRPTPDGLILPVQPCTTPP